MHRTDGHLKADEGLRTSEGMQPNRARVEGMRESGADTHDGGKWVRK